MDNTGRTVVPKGMRVVGVPVGTEQFKLSDFASICHFPPVTSASNSPTLHHMPSYFKLRRFGVVALAPIIAGYGAAAAGLSPEEVAQNPTVCQNQIYLGHEALRQAHLPIREGGLGLTSSSSIKGVAYIGYHALALGRIVATSARGNLPSLLERLPERPMVSAIIEELRPWPPKHREAK